MVRFETKTSWSGTVYSKIYCDDGKDNRYLGIITGDKYIRLTDNMFDFDEMIQIIEQMKLNRRNSRV